MELLCPSIILKRFLVSSLSKQPQKFLSNNFQLSIWSHHFRHFYKKLNGHLNCLGNPKYSDGFSNTNLYNRYRTAHRIL